MLPLKGLLLALVLLLPGIACADAAHEARKEILYKPQELAKLDRAALEQTTGIPQQCWSLKDDLYCNMWFGIEVLYSKTGKISAVYYSSFRFKDKQHFGRTAYQDFVSNGKPVNETILRAWKDLVATKPDLQSNALILWKNPRPGIASIAFIAGDRRGDGSSTHFELSRIEVVFK